MQGALSLSERYVGVWKPPPNPQGLSASLPCMSAAPAQVSSEPQW